MSNCSYALSRLMGALESAGLSAHVEVSDGTAGIASPIRLATEWTGFHLRRPGASATPKCCTTICVR